MVASIAHRAVHSDDADEDGFPGPVHTAVTHSARLLVLRFLPSL